jgi:hypothetical protein
MSLTLRRFSVASAAPLIDAQAIGENFPEK